MKLRFIGNATEILEHDNFKILCDPWFNEPLFDGAWIHDPPIVTKIEDVLDVDAIYISHLHQDHCDEKALELFDKGIPIIVYKDKQGFEFTKNRLKRMGFYNFISLNDGESREIGPFEATMFGPFVKHPQHADDCEIGNILDTALLLKAGGYSVLNTNDNSPSKGIAKIMVEHFGKFDLVQLNYNAAGCYPACFMNLSLEEKKKEHDRIRYGLLNHMIEVAKVFDAKYVMPFAGAYKLAGDLSHMNEYLGTSSYEEACDAVTKASLTALYMRENDEFNFATGTIRTSSPQTLELAEKA